MTKAISILLIISSLVLLCSFHDTQAQINWCPEEDTFLGGNCESSPRNQCLIDFLGKYGARSMPKNCQCVDSRTDQRLCKCEVVCGNDTPQKVAKIGV